MRLQADVILYDVTDVKCASMDEIDKVRERIVKALSDSDILYYYHNYAKRSLMIMDIGIALCVTLAFIGLIACILFPAVAFIIYCVYCIKTHRKFHWHECIRFITR